MNKAKSENETRKKKILFLSVTDKEGTTNRAYSNFVFALCKYVLRSDETITKDYDVAAFLRHDMLQPPNIRDSVYNAFIDYDYFVILIDDSDGLYNPNVWFELGLISTLDKPILPISSSSTNIPFYVGDVNVFRLTDEIMQLFETHKNSCIRNDQIEDLIEHFEKFHEVKRENSGVKRFTLDFAQVFKNTADYGNPFKSIMDTVRISNFGYRSLTHLFEKSNIIDQIKRKGQPEAEYIPGELQAFKALTKAVEQAETSLRTSRFADQSIVNPSQFEKEEISAAHNDFMKALYEASKKPSIKICDRIICNNNPLKWSDIYEVLMKSSDKMTVYVRKSNYNINFELVIIDEKVAFIHFYQTNKSGDVNESLKATDNHEINRYDTKDQRIKSTLKITDKEVCVELSRIFDRLHHRDFDDENPKDMSRTLLGVEEGNYTLGENYGCFRVKKNKNQRGTIADMEAQNSIRKLFIDAINNWKIPEKDKMIMAAGLCIIFDTDDILAKISTLTPEKKKTVRDEALKYKR